MNLALISPSHSAYSETFIHAHKRSLAGKIFYYFSGNLPNQLENYGILRLTLVQRIAQKLRLKLGVNKFSNRELVVYKSFKKNNIQVVVAEYGGTGNAVLKVCKGLKIPLIVHFHGFDASLKKVIEQNNNYQDVFNYASYIVVVSEKMLINLRNMGCPAKKLIYNVYGPGNKFLKITPRFSRKKQFIGVGRFVDKKAPYYLILAFKEVVKKHPDAHLKIAGNGILFNTCKNLINFFELQDNIELLGVITPKEYRQYLKESLGFVQHSIEALNGDSEGTPVAILEASAAGLPVISTYHAGIPDVIIDGQTGLLVQEHDVMGMSRDMLRLIEEPNLASELGRKGKERIENNYTLQRHIYVLNNLVEKCTTQTVSF